MKLAHIPGEVFAEEWRHHPFAPFADFRLEDFEHAFHRVESHIDGFQLDREYLFAPLRSLHFNMETAEDFQRVGQKIIESAPHVSEYRWPEFEAWYADLLSGSRLRKPKEWHLAGELWTVLVRQALWQKGLRFAIYCASTLRDSTGFVYFSRKENPETAEFIERNNLGGLIHYTDPKLLVEIPINPWVSPWLLAERKS